MFTGIITDIGEVISTEQRGDLKARIKTSYDTAGIDIGASIAHDGVCLTVIALGDDWYDVEISAESIDVTNIGRNMWHVGRKLNLERALKVGDELGGHIVSGHVDGVAEVVAVEDEGDSTRVTLRAPKELLTAGLQKARFNQKVAAELLGLTYHQLRGKIRKHELDLA